MPRRVKQSAFYFPTLFCKISDFETVSSHDCRESSGFIGHCLKAMTSVLKRDRAGTGYPDPSRDPAGIGNFHLGRDRAGSGLNLKIWSGPGRNRDPECFNIFSGKNYYVLLAHHKVL
jgi:hypothetical protein